MFQAVLGSPHERQRSQASALFAVLRSEALHLRPPPYACRFVDARAIEPSRSPVARAATNAGAADLQHRYMGPGAR